MVSEKQRKELVLVASDARSRAYAPQSGFHVGAAALADDGTIYAGVNVENSSYGLTCCAERIALFSAVAAGQRKFRAIAIATDGGHAPCGACRQVIAELAANAVLFLVDTSNRSPVKESSIDELLPQAFSLPPRE
jgi:cytidine deaminase